MSKQVQVGIIGCGAIAERLHVPDYHTSPDASIVAFCDTDQRKANSLAAQYGPDVAVYGDWKKLLADPAVEAVSVCLPNFLHAPVTIAAAKAGKHVMVEKPMATSSAEAQKMIDAAKKAGVLLMVNQTQRRYPLHVKAKEVIDSGMIGEVLHITGVFGHEGPEHWSPGGKWFFKRKEARFGAMADLGIHKADLIRFLTGKEAGEICGFYARLEKKRTDVEDNFVASLKFQDGTLGMLASSWTFKGGENNYTIINGSKGTLRIATSPEKPLVADLISPKCTIEFPVPPPFNDYEGTWGVDVGGAFARAVLGVEAPFCTGEEGKKSLEVILAAEKAADSGRTVKLKH